MTGSALERAVLELPEATSASIEEGELDYYLVEITQADLEALTSRDAETAEAFLQEAVEEADGMAGHWEEMLDGNVEPGDFPPVIAFLDGGPETIDGDHRMAGMVMHPTDEAPWIVVGVPSGSKLADCWPTAGQWTVLDAAAHLELSRFDQRPSEKAATDAVPSPS
jgi:hypothetical protein